MADEQKGTVYVVLVAATRSEQRPMSDGVTQVDVVPVANVFEVLMVDDERPRTFRAANDVAAIKVAEKEMGQKFDHGAVAVPRRNWRPRTPEDKMIPRRLWT